MNESQNLEAQSPTQYIIMKASRIPPGKAIPASAYSGPSCRDAGVVAGRVYDDLAVALRDAALLTKVNPVGFVVWEIGTHISGRGR